MTSELAAIHMDFRLEGEVVYRKWDNQPTRHVPRPGKASSVADSRGKRHLLHRVKFALYHGWLPSEVDHRDREPSNCAISNLRPATRQQNNWNRTNYRKQREYPVGVSPNGKRFKAQVNVHGKTLHLGTYDTPEEASAVYQRYCLQQRGDYHPCSNGGPGPRPLA